MVRQIHRLLILSVLLIAWPMHAGASTFDRRADSIVEDLWPEDGPGASVIVTLGGRTIYRKQRGLADLGRQRAIHKETVFRLGSLTKQFTAAAILKLVDEGKLNLDDPVKNHLSGFHPAAGEIRIRQLLNHSSGIRNPHIARADGTRHHSTEDLLATFRSNAPRSKPGSEWSYSNGGYTVLGAILEKVTGKAWHAAIRATVIEPLGLRSIRAGTDEKLVEDMARGYTEGEAGPEPAFPAHMSIPHAAGGLIGSIEDLAKWSHALNHGRVISGGSYREMTFPARLTNGKAAPYGFGLRLEDIRGHSAIGHGSSIFGFSGDALYIPEQDLFVAVLSNSDKPSGLTEVAARRLAAMALGVPFPEFHEADVPIELVTSLLGDYGHKDSAEVRFHARGDRLFTTFEGGAETAVFAAGNDTFYYGPKSLHWFRIIRRPDGRHQMEMHIEGRKQGVTLTRMASPSGAQSH